MNISNILEISKIFNSFGVDKIPSVPLDWIGSIIGWIFDLFSNFYGAVALGVIVFTLCLKTLVLPLDIYSRVKTKKQSLLMKKMKPQMEKLKKQYANDEKMYQQKVAELQKANGFSPIGACLPMIVSLIIFMTVFSSFSVYSNYATLKNYNEMVGAYNSSVEVYVQTGENDTNEQFLLGKDNNYQCDFGKFADFYATQDEEFNVEEFAAMDENAKWEVVIDFVQLGAREAVVDWYEENKVATEFGWIGNMWYPDSYFNKKVPSYSDFASSVSRALGSSNNANYELGYNEVTYNLSEQKQTPNGYFVLIVLSIGFMLLQQFIMMRTQKDTNELATVDGSGASANKWMMIIMPIMFGIFSFFYSAAFSVYMITNTLYGLITTLIINKIVTVKFENRNDDDNSYRPSKNAKRLK